MQKGGDYRESFQSPYVAPEHLAEAQRMAAAVTEALTGAGLWGVEFFLSHDNGVYFSELSPRPHDTGMVTLAGTQNLNEFELHLRAVLGLPIPAVTFERLGATRRGPLAPGKPRGAALRGRSTGRWPPIPAPTCASSANPRRASTAAWASSWAMRRWATTSMPCAAG